MLITSDHFDRVMSVVIVYINAVLPVTLLDHIQLAVVVQHSHHES